MLFIKNTSFFHEFQVAEEIKEEEKESDDETDNTEPAATDEEQVDLSKSMLKKYKIKILKEKKAIIELLSEKPAKFKHIMKEKYGEATFKVGYKIIK